MLGLSFAKYAAFPLSMHDRSKKFNILTSMSILLGIIVKANGANALLEVMVAIFGTFNSVTKQ